MSERIRRFVEAMQVQPGDRILEIGCGHGIAASLICSQLASGHYLGLDRPPKMIAAARKRNAAFIGAGLAEFVEAAFESCEPGERRFDKVPAMRVRAFHERPGEARRLAERWLAPDGRLFVEYDEPAAKHESS